MNTFKDLIEKGKTFRTITIPLYIVSNNTGKITIVNSSHFYIFSRDITIYCGKGKEFRIEKNADTTVLERVIYTGFYKDKKIVTDYLYINKEDAKTKALEILNKKRQKIFDEILKITLM